MTVAGVSSSSGAVAAGSTLTGPAPSGTTGPVARSAAAATYALAVAPAQAGSAGAATARTTLADPRRGTPTTAPAVRVDFASTEDSAPPPSHRSWRMTEVVAAIGSGPAAERLIEAANRPGPAAPGSLLEAVKALRPLPRPKVDAGA